MKCRDIENLLDDRSSIELTSEEQEGVGAHLSSCESCKSAWRSAQALRHWSDTPAPRPRAGLFEEAMRVAVPASAAHRLTGRPFWLGAAVGGALAASIVVAVLGLGPAIPDSGETLPTLTMALHDHRDVSVAIDSGRALADAQIRVVLTGGIELSGFEGQSAISWTTDLSPGTNRLRLPVTAISPGGGQLLVEVEHGSKRRVFLVQVNVDGSATELGAASVEQGPQRVAASAPPGSGRYFVKYTEPEIPADV